MDFKLKDKTFSARRVFCIGRNYVAHIEELGNEMPSEPVIFMKPATSLVPCSQKKVAYPEGTENLHFEAELVILIGKEGKPADEVDAKNYVAGLTAGLDFTMRDVQDDLREQGLSWEISKAFDQSSPIGEFIPCSADCDLTNLKFSCRVNGELRQDGDSSLMIYPITKIIKAVSKYWKLLPGDVIFTGTPAGVGQLKRGDNIEICAPNGKTYSWDIA
jgi:2-keto-4-pentenoate hydratase/2-oxohepta-3-ene-1,7-dioic acid hydratase in catechol pathway